MTMDRRIEQNTQLRMPRERFGRITNSVGHNHHVSHSVFPARIIGSKPHPDDDPVDELWVFPRQYFWEPMFKGSPTVPEIVVNNSRGGDGIDPLECFYDIGGGYQYAYNTQEFQRDVQYRYDRIEDGTPVIMFIGNLPNVRDVDPCSVFIVPGLQLVEWYFWFTQWGRPQVVVCDDPDNPV